MFGLVGGGAFYAWQSLLGPEGGSDDLPPQGGVRPPLSPPPAAGEGELGSSPQVGGERDLKAPAVAPAVPGEPTGVGDGDGGETASAGTGGEGEPDPTAGEPATPPAPAPDPDADGGTAAGDPVRPEPEPEPSPEPGRPAPIGPDAALEAFLDAEDWQTRSLYVHPDAGVHEEMALFYQQNGDQPLKYTGYEQKARGKVPGTDRDTFLYQVKTEEVPKGFIVSVEHTADGYRIDWRAFVQFGYGLLEAFADDPESPPAAFYVTAKRSHYFGSDISGAEGMLCVRLISPVDPDREIFAFASEGALAADEIKEKLRWGRKYRPVVQLEWVGIGGQRYIRIKSIDRMSWRELN